MKHILKTLGLLILVPATIVIGTTFIAMGTIPREPSNNNVPTIAPTATTKSPSPTAKPEVKSATSQRESSIQKVQPSPTPDPDPIVNCNVHASCGGGTRKLKLSECNKTTCCQIGGSWYFYPSKDECNKAQTAQAPKYTAPTPWPTTALVTCPLSYGTYQLTPEKCNEFKTQDQAINQAAGEYGQYLNQEWDRQEQVRKEKACQEVRGLWDAVQAELRSKKYGNSADEAREFIYYRDQYQRLISEAC